MQSGYRKLPLMLLLHFVVMYAVMYSMVAEAGHIYLNLSRAYMAGLMVAPMLPLMLLLMPSMYPDRKMNAMLWAGSIAVFALLFAAVRTQAAVGDTQFLRAMIPHHSSAIVMCEAGSISDPETAKLCGEIVKTQKEEIAQMKSILARMRR